jgi:hypothetical protein
MTNKLRGSREKMMADDEAQDGGVFARAMRNKMRGGNDYWFWRDKPVMERGAVREVLAQAGLDAQALRSRAPWR